MLEEVPTSTKLTPDETDCQKHFMETTSRLPDGRFQIRLPFKDNKIPNLNFTLPLALRRFNLM
jgi:hypothetical protein